MSSRLNAARPPLTAPAPPASPPDDSPAARAAALAGPDAMDMGEPPAESGERGDPGAGGNCWLPLTPLVLLVLRGDGDGGDGGGLWLLPPVLGLSGDGGRVPLLPMLDLGLSGDGGRGGRGDSRRC